MVTAVGRLYEALAGTLLDVEARHVPKENVVSQTLQMMTFRTSFLQSKELRCPFLPTTPRAPL